MTEVEYVISRFDDCFREHKGKRIVLHGSRGYAEAIIRRFEADYRFAGVMSRDVLEGPAFLGLPVLREEDLPTLDVQMVILTERVRYAEEVYQSIHGICEEKGILLFNMYGLDECATHRSVESCVPLGLSGWKQLCRPYQIVAFEVMDAFLHVRHYTGELAQRYSLRVLVSWLVSQGIEVKFSLRRSFPEEIQLACLRRPALLPDLEEHLIRRQGEDLSFRAMREANPDKRILYIGTGLVNECLLPRCYGIDTYRYQSIDYVSRMPVERGAEASPFDRQLEEKLRRRIRESDIVSFDVFDTLILRRTLTETDVFELTERRAVRKGLPARSFARVRKRSELPQLDIYAVYDRIRAEMGWDDETAKAVLELELETERSVIIPRTELVRLLEYALSQGKRVVLTSDMYLPEPLLREILEENGIRGYEKLFVSCDYQKAKADGLYDELRRLYPGDGKILHIGDRPDVDGAVCAAYGVESAVVPSALSLAMSRGWEKAVRSASTLMERCLVGMTVAELFRDPFQNPNLRELSMDERMRRFAVSSVGPLAVGHTTWLIEKVKERECDGVLFMSRDGWLPMKLYQGLEFRDELPPAYYYYANRRSSFLCCADDERQIPMIADTARYFELSGEKTMASYYGLEKDEILPEREDEDRVEFIRRHWSAVVKRAEDARAGYLAYSKGLGMKENGSYAVVDFIATGTTQTFLERFLPYRLFGLYYGNHRPDARLSYDITDYLETENDTLLQNFIELEDSFISPEPAVDRVTREGETVFAPEIRSGEELRQLQLVHETALRFAGDFFSLFYERGEVIDPRVPEETFAADGFHWVQTSAYDDWARTNVAPKAWQGGNV